LNSVIVLLQNGQGASGSITLDDVAVLMRH
jgi:hypothetical protein